MAFIPIYYAESFRGLMLSQSATTKQDLINLSANTNNLDIGVDTAVAYPNGVGPQGPLPLYPLGAYPVVYKINCTTACNLTGIVAPTVTAQQMVPMILQNVGTATVTLKNATTSTAANQFNCTGGSDLTLPANSYRVIFYQTSGSINKWTVGQSMYSGGFGVAVPNSDGVIVLLDAAFWDAWHTGNYDNAGTKTANTADVWYAYGYTAPTPLTYTTNTEGNATTVIQSGVSKVVQCKRELPGMTLISKTGTVFVQFSKNEQGQGFNKQGW